MVAGSSAGKFGTAQCRLEAELTLRTVSRIFPLPLALLSCVHSVPPHPMPYVSSHRNPPVHTRVATVMDSALSSRLGLPSLAASSLPPEYREVRLSRGHGMILGGEYPVVRITESQSQVSGEVILFRAVLSGSADKVKVVRWEARVARPRASVDWHGVMMILDFAGISDLEPPNYATAYMDAGDLVVEVLRGSNYRAYEFNAPQLRTDSISRKAARIAALVDSLNRLTRDQD
jgi:hypothetical protein